MSKMELMVEVNHFRVRCGNSQIIFKSTGTRMHVGGKYKSGTCYFTIPNNKINSLAAWSRAKALCGRNATQDNPGSLLWRLNTSNEKNNQKSKPYYLSSGQRS
jgi:hypothetical protein